MPDAEDLVVVDQKISFLQWFSIVTGPFVMPLFAPFILIFGIKTYSATDRIKRINSKAMLVGLGQWAYRVTTTFAVFAIVFFLMAKLNRFG